MAGRSATTALTGCLAKAASASSTWPPSWCLSAERRSRSDQETPADRHCHAQRGYVGGAFGNIVAFGLENSRLDVEPLFSGADNAIDALDRRVEFKIVGCG